MFGFSLKPWTADDEFVSRALHGDLGEEARMCAQEVANSEPFFSDASGAEVAEAIRTRLEDGDDDVDLTTLAADQQRREADAEAATRAYLAERAARGK